MPPIPGVWHWHSLLARHAKSLKAAATRVAKALDAQISSGQTSQIETQLEKALVRNTPKQPVHPLARIRQSQARWFSSAASRGGARNFSSAAGKQGARFDRASLPKSRVGTYISRSSGRAPFASTLRPNLTGGTLGRTAGGYSLGSGRIGGARYFSHGPACQAQVVQNVSQAVRAFFTQGQKAQFDGVSPRGEKRYKATTTLQDSTSKKLRSLPVATPGSRLEFAINPTITALTPLAGLAGYNTSQHDAEDHLNTEGLLDVLSVDFSRALKDLAAVLNDLKRLSALGDLPITYEASSIRVHFPGVDAETVDRLCDELNVSRGQIVQDANFDAFAGTEIALLFPFAPSKEASVEDIESLFETAAPYYVQDKKPLFPSAERQVISLEDMLTPSSPAYSTQSDSGMEDILLVEGNPWQQLSSPSGFESVRSGSGSEIYGTSRYDPLEYQGFEGIYRFIGELDAAAARA
jgi:hypothetical protein